MLSTNQALPTATLALSAVLTGQRVTFVYIDKHGVRSIRHARFNSIERCANGSRVVKAYDLDREAPRTFCLRGILGITGYGATVTLTCD